MAVMSNFFQIQSCILLWSTDLYKANMVTYLGLGARFQKIAYIV